MDIKNGVSNHIFFYVWQVPAHADTHRESERERVLFREKLIWNKTLVAGAILRAHQFSHFDTDTECDEFVWIPFAFIVIIDFPLFAITVFRNQYHHHLHRNPIFRHKRKAFWLAYKKREKKNCDSSFKAFEDFANYVSLCCFYWIVIIIIL